ncbi:hypothetical protein THAOC_16647 [Thalassiosira oceanica]|uniref:Uncharacterized protein n=1 Tax=Thalassiosira oceanica TaxID=159749 RepID=K0SBR2_THAOC|nr:hypothetical protein THAOC_16647 [Thalassiosira oceanica]|eukprot:EJK62730.1 hypothetical protein THAOC_16647 [Thalassiosira oceanica]
MGREKSVNQHSPGKGKKYPATDTCSSPRVEVSTRSQERHSPTDERSPYKVGVGAAQIQNRQTRPDKAAPAYPRT